MKSPFEFGLVVKLALVLGVVLAAARVLTTVYGSAGLLPLSALAGLVDVDAVALAASRMASREGLDPGLAAGAVLLAAAVDSVSKVVIGLAVGGRPFATRFGAGTAVAALAAGMGLALA